MVKVYPPRPVSCGILLSYKCNSECRHCMYASSPRWRADWISEPDLSRIISQLSDKVVPAPGGRWDVGINYGIHLTGGEPFLNFDLLLRAIEIVKDYGLPSAFVETNAFWCIDDASTGEKFRMLKEAGLDGVLVSVNPFILEYVPFERTKMAIEIGGRIFGGNLMIYQEVFHHQFQRLGLRGTMNFNRYMETAGLSGLRYVELLPMGRACYRLRGLFMKYPAKYFLEENCRGELLRGWHTHIDNYGNYITGYCGGISLGDARNLDELLEKGIDLDERPILGALMNSLGELYEFAVKEFNYIEKSDGYISKCDLCLDIRRHIVENSGEYIELSPIEFYRHLR
ncbi:MAG: radical SAM protein [Aigarchaeota archaeon]|nr:radical SAM protein [Aigarchaeota archaeon]